MRSWSDNKIHISHLHTFAHLLNIILPILESLKCEQHHHHRRHNHRMHNHAITTDNRHHTTFACTVAPSSELRKLCYWVTWHSWSRGLVANTPNIAQISVRNSIDISCLAALTWIPARARIIVCVCCVILWINFPCAKAKEKRREKAAKQKADTATTEIMHVKCCVTFATFIWFG